MCGEHADIQMSRDDGPGLALVALGKHRNSDVPTETEPGVEVEKGVAASVRRRVGGVV